MLYTVYVPLYRLILIGHRCLKSRHRCNGLISFLRCNHLLTVLLPQKSWFSPSLLDLPFSDMDPTKICTGKGTVTLRASSSYRETPGSSPVSPQESPKHESKSGVLPRSLGGWMSLWFCRGGRGVVSSSAASSFSRAPRTVISVPSVPFVPSVPSVRTGRQVKP